MISDKARDEESQEILKALENIDDDCADYEVHLVAMVDHLMAKKYGIRDPPGLAYFRHGKHIKFTGMQRVLSVQPYVRWVCKQLRVRNDFFCTTQISQFMWTRLICVINIQRTFIYLKKSPTKKQTRFAKVYQYEINLI